MNFSAYLPLLIELMLKSSVLLGVACAVVWAARRASAANRHMIWLATFGALLAVPWVWAWTAADTAKVRDAAGADTVLVVKLPAELARTSAAPTLASVEKPVSPTRALMRRARAFWREGVVAAWLGGLVILLVWRMIGAGRLRWLRRRSRLIGDARIEAWATRIAVDQGAGPWVEVRCSESCPVAMTWGTLRPVVMLPPDAPTWSEERIERVLRHELAHVARRDCLARLFGQVACAVYWPNPLVWLAARRLRLAQEQACDDRVLAAGVEAHAYAEELLVAARALKRRRWASAAVAMAEPSTLERRIRAVLSPCRRDIVRRGGRVWAGFAAVGALAACSTVRVDGADGGAVISQEGVEIRRASEAEAAAMVDFDDQRKDVRQVEIEVSYLELKGMDPQAPNVAEVFGRALTPGATTSPAVLGHLPSSEAKQGVRELGKRTGADLLSAPRVTVLNGNRATISVAQELRYPKRFDVPPASPEAAPDSYDSRNIGVETSVLPHVLADGSVALDLKTVVREFEGFLSGPGDGDAALPFVPVFIERVDTASVVLRPGETAVLRASPRKKTLPENAPDWARRASGGEVADTSTVLIMVAVRVIVPGPLPPPTR